jgi:hypothetical protein
MQRRGGLYISEQNQRRRLVQARSVDQMIELSVGIAAKKSVLMVYFGVCPTL